MQWPKFNIFNLGRPPTATDQTSETKSRGPKPLPQEARVMVQPARDADLVDVAINVYGKPFQTAVTIASLIACSGRHIGKIFVQEERDQPIGPSVTAVLSCFPQVEISHYRPKHHIGCVATPIEELEDEDVRLSIRYQYAWEHTRRNFLFVTHNDCLFSADVIGEMLARIKQDESSGVGIVGQCWNCPASSAGVCHGTKYEQFNPTFEEALQLVAAYPSPRTKPEMIDRVSPMPFPECRLGEFACLIDMARTRSHVMPLGKAPPFGLMGLDIGVDWFRALVLLGHRFTYWYEGVQHAPFSDAGCGFASHSDQGEYERGESRAAEHLAANYPNIYAALAEAIGTAGAAPGMAIIDERKRQPSIFSQNATKVDVAISAYGKPWQTAATIASISSVSGRHIDKIYLQAELDQPNGADISAIVDAFPHLNIVYFEPEIKIAYVPATPAEVNDPGYRRSIRYQRAWEETDKKFLFVCHNDCVFHIDIIGHMLDRLADGTFSGVGRIGQCWNCFASKAGVCNGDIYESYRPSYAEARELEERYGVADRPYHVAVDKISPMPLPECRLNEFGCLINVEKCRPDVLPFGDVWPLGAMHLDTGTAWFRGLVLRGHRFLNWYEGLEHAPFSSASNGSHADRDQTEYFRSEWRAAENVAAFHPDTYSRLTARLKIPVLL